MVHQKISVQKNEFKALAFEPAIHQQMEMCTYSIWQVLTIQAKQNTFDAMSLK